MNDVMLETVYAYICRYWRQFGIGPTLEEIASACYTSKPNVYRYLDRLQMAGRIARAPGRARSITLLAPCPDSSKDT